MCGRYTLRRASLVYAAMGATPYLPSFEEFDEKRVVPRFNVAPSQTVPIVRISGEGKRVVSEARWGLIPSWVKGKPKSAPINARAETVRTSGMFRQAMERRRCLVPADGFYEWKGAKPPKQPYFIHKPDDGIFAFAGLWERWKPDSDAEPVDTFTIITTAANEVIKPIHNRMPVILSEADYAKWLDRATAEKDVEGLLKPYEGELEAARVSTKVNSAKNEGPELILNEAEVT
jgi:putative SOS response-associated peptidase YedK